MPKTSEQMKENLKEILEDKHNIVLDFVEEWKRGYGRLIIMLKIKERKNGKSHR
jgi:hypothetical protein